MRRRHHYQIFIPLWISLLLSAGTVVAQENNSIPLADAIQIIEKKAKVKFFYASDFPLSTALPRTSIELPLDDFLRSLSESFDIGHLRYFSETYIYLFQGVPPALDFVANQPIDAPDVAGKTAVRSETTFTLRGIVKDVVTGEKITGANVFVEELATGVITDSQGNFSTRVPEGTYRIRVTSVGKAPTSQRIVVDASKDIEFEMYEQNIQLEDVVVLSQGTDRNVNSTEMGQIKVDIKTLKSIPPLMGEVDIIRSIQLLPGVTTVGEGASGFNVRGGNVDQNLILVDDAPVLNASHLFGFFSTFNPDFVKDVTLFKGFMPANYGGRISSVLDVKLKDGNDTQLSGTGGIGIISSRLLLEGPIVKGKTTFVIGGRYAYPNWLLRQVPDLNVQRSSAWFYDFNFRVKHTINDKNSLHFSAYRTQDQFKFAADTTYAWSTTNASLRWNTVISPKLYANITGLISKYENSIAGLASTKEFNANFGIDMWGGKVDFTYAIGTSHRLDFGTSATNYTFHNGQLANVANSSVNPKSLPDEHSLETGIYVSDELKVSPKLSVNFGLRYSRYDVFGEGDVFTYQPGVPKDPSTVTGVVHFGKGERIQTYDGWEPRLSTKFSIDDRSSIKFSYNRNLQYLQLISNTAAISPLDLWKTSNYYIKPQTGNQVALGYFRNFKQNKYEFSVEGYYKVIENIVDYKDGATLFMNQYLESALLNAKGESYGAELLIKKKEDKLTGWLSYTYSRSFRQTQGATPEENVNSGNKYPSNFDKPHNLVAVANYAFTKRLSMSANFTYSTGRPTTYPQSVYLFDGYSVAQFAARNDARIPDYHRLDLSLTIEQSFKHTKKWKGSWVFSIYNVYGRKNPYSVFLRPQYKGFQTQVYQLAVIGTVFPSVTYNFKF